MLIQSIKLHNNNKTPQFSQQVSFKRMHPNRKNQLAWREMVLSAFRGNDKIHPQNSTVSASSKITEFIKKHILNAEAIQMSKTELKKFAIESKQIDKNMEIELNAFIKIIDKKQKLTQTEYLTVELLRDLLMENHQKIHDIYTKLAKNILVYNDTNYLNQFLIYILDNEYHRLYHLLVFENEMALLAKKFHKPMTQDKIDDIITEIGRIEREIEKLKNT